MVWVIVPPLICLLTAYAGYTGRRKRRTLAVDRRRRKKMHNGMTRYHAHRHPVATGLIVLTLSPFLLAAVALYAVAYVLGVAVDMALGRR
jgi:hypothetical protein